MPKFAQMVSLHTLPHVDHVAVTHRILSLESWHVCLRNIAFVSAELNPTAFCCGQLLRWELPAHNTEHLSKHTARLPAIA